MNPKRLSPIAFVVAPLCFAACQAELHKTSKHAATDQQELSPTEQRIEDLLAQMTLAEKLGQLTLKSTGLDSTGPTVPNDGQLENDVRAGRVGNLFNAFTVDFTTRIQHLAVDNTRLKIPLLFGFDVIHGYRTIFPLPLAEAASWDLEAIGRSARIAATEASAAGLHWTYAPMVDIARDPRWGRIAEGAGEDPYLGALIARARVQGFQGPGAAADVLPTDAVLACVKHFAGYGAALAGRDYNTVDMSELQMREVYLRPFKAAVDAGVASIMTSFNEWNGVPSTGNPLLLTQILRKEWQFKGFVVTDYTSIPEMIKHGIVRDEAGAARLAITAGVDMDMESKVFLTQLPQLVNDGVVPAKTVDDAVRRVLREKFRLGLFDDPYRYSDAAREKAGVFTPETLDSARDMARKSIVLLKNGTADAKGLLPLDKGVKTIALIGPLGKSKADVLGSWRGFGHPEEAESLYDGLQAKVPNAKILYAEGAKIDGTSQDGFQAALDAARQADVVVAALGESAGMSGEASSRTDIGLPGAQRDLLAALLATGKPVVLVLMNGRPLTLEWEDAHVSSILETWFLGSRAGSAIADVLFGDYNPSGKLTVTFPRRVGQIPLFYNHKNTGRPDGPDVGKYASKYLDSPTSPLYVFGYGLSYTSFAYADLKVQPTEDAAGFQSLAAEVTVKNTGAVAGKETVQLYVQAKVGRVTRPVQELKGFKQVTLAPGEQTLVTFTLTRQDLTYYAPDDAGRIVEAFDPTEVRVMVGGDSAHTIETSFEAR